MIIATAALICIFFIDQFMIMRRWRPISMIGKHMVKRVRYFMYISVTILLYTSINFISSWPMDYAILHPDGTFEKVDKQPSYWPWEKSWQTGGVDQLLNIYRWAFYISAAILLFQFIGLPSYILFKRCFIKRRNSLIEMKHSFLTSKVTTVPFQAVPEISAYCPIFQRHADVYLISDTTNCLQRHKPKTVSYVLGVQTDLTKYVPVNLSHKCLSVVKWYGGEDKNGVFYNIHDEKIERPNLNESSSFRFHPYDTTIQSIPRDTEEIKLQFPISPYLNSKDWEELQTLGFSKPKLDDEYIQAPNSSKRPSSLIKNKQNSDVGFVKPKLIQPNSILNPKETMNKNSHILAKNKLLKEEMDLIRSLRPECLLIPDSSLIKGQDHLELLSFNELYEYLIEHTPIGLTGKNKAQVYLSRHDVQFQQRLRSNKALLRRLFIRILSENPSSNKHQDMSGKLSLSLFLRYIQTFPLDRNV